MHHSLHSVHSDATVHNPIPWSYKGDKTEALPSRGFHSHQRPRGREAESSLLGEGQGEGSLLRGRSLRDNHGGLRTADPQSSPELSHTMELFDSNSGGGKNRSLENISFLATFGSN